MTGAATMMALRAHSRGGPETLRYEAAPRPVPAVGEVLVAVHAAAITFAELGWDATWTRDGRDRTPTIPGHAGARRDDEVLVHGGAGGVGGFAVQLAVVLGARVTATCLGADVEYVRSL